MDSSQALRLCALVVAWSVVCPSTVVMADAKTQKSIQEALADADRYAGGYTDAYVSNAWERAVDGWVRGGYTLVSGDVHTDVRYVVDPSGEMRVMARRPGAASTAGKQAVTASSANVNPVEAIAYRPPYYQRLVHHFDSLDVDDDAFDDVDVDSEVDVDDEDPFFFDMDTWGTTPVGDWTRLTQAGVVGGLRRGPDMIATNAPYGRAGCKSTRCHANRLRFGGPAGSVNVGGHPKASPSTALGTTGVSRGPAGISPAATPPPAVPDTVGAASFQTGRYNLMVKTLKE